MEVKIPAGVDNGMQLSLRGEGDLGEKGGPRGDVIVQITVQSHDVFKRDGDDIFMDKKISFAQAILGGEITVPTLEGKAQITIPAGTLSGRSFRLKGKGIQYLNGHGRGCLYVKVIIDVPTTLTKEQKQALINFAKTMGEDVKSHEKSGLGKLFDKK